MDKKEKAIERAKKLMAMAADSSSPNEAAIAARRARAIIDKYQIDMSDLKESSKFGEHTSGTERKRVPIWEQGLCASIAKLNDCIANFNWSRQFVFKGFEEDAIVCRFMHIYLTENCKRECKKHMQSTQNGCRDSFKSGYAYAVCLKITEIVKERDSHLKTSSGKSLVAIKKSIVEQEFGAEKYKEAPSRSVANENSFCEGVDAGDRVNIVSGTQKDHQENISANHYL